MLLSSYGLGDQRNISNNMAKMCSLARAKYDNLAESHDELAFRKGDVLTVVDQKIEGLDGWWLCSFRGKQGIVPANRVTLLAGMYYESALRFSTSPESSISDGGGVDYDVPRQSPQNRKLPPLPNHSKPALESVKVNGGGEPHALVRELVYDIPKSLEKTKIHAGASPSHASNCASIPEHSANNVYDSPTQLHIVTPAGLMSQRVSGGALSPPYKSGDSAVDVRSNRSSMMSNNSSPPGSSVCDSSQHSELAADIYDVPNKLAAHRRVTARHHKHSESVESTQRNTNTSFEGYYDVPKTVKETLQEYRDSGIYDNARLSVVQTSPLKDASDDVYDIPAPSRTVGAPSGEQAPVYDVLPAAKTSVGGNHQLEKADSLDITPEMDKLNLELEAAIEIIVELQQHVHTSANRLLSFVHARWRQRSNLESVLYDLKLACVGLQSTLQEFFDFGTGALVNSASLVDCTVMNRLSQGLAPLKSKLDSVNNSMKALSSIKWHIAKLEELERNPDGSPSGGGGAAGDLMRLMVVAREVGEDVNRVASVIHGNSSLLFKSNAPRPSSSVRSLLSEARDSASHAALQRQTMTSCLVTEEDTVESYHEYDYCEVTVKEDQPVKPIPDKNAAIDLEQDSQYLRYYLQHVHAICDIVQQHVTRLEDIVESGVESNQALVTQGKLVVSTAHRLVYIGDTLCRCIRQSNIHMAVSDDANLLCNVLKDFIMSTKEAALAQPAARAAAFSKLRPNVRAVQRQAESFRNVIQTHAK